MSEQTFIEKAAGLARVTERLLEGKEKYKQAAEETAKKLVALGSVNTEDHEKVAAALREDPEKVLSMLTKVAESNRDLAKKLRKQAEEAKEASVKKDKAPAYLGTPDAPEKRSSTTQEKKESDRVWDNMFAV